MPQKKIDTRQLRTFQFSKTEVKEDGTFTGYASVFGAIDSYGTGWAKGCFSDSLKDIADNNRTLPMLWSHDSKEPIGKYTKLEEDDYGLRVEGKVITSIPRGKQVYDLMREGIVSGLSVSVDIQEFDYDQQNDLITFTKCDLYEISPCVFPAVKEAQIDTVRSFDVRDLERHFALWGCQEQSQQSMHHLLTKR